MKNYTILFFLILFSNIFAQNTDSLFVKGNEFYKKGNYQDAIGQYEQILKKSKVSPELYFNLGNAYYKQNRIAPSVYYYEKALLLKPNDEDIKYNLGLANQMKMDKIDKVPENLLLRIKKNIANWFSPDTWAYITVFWSFAGLLAFLVFLFTQKPNLKRLTFAGMFISLFLLLFAIYFAYLSQHLKQIKHAIVFVPQTDLLNEPNLTADKVISIHEGSKVQIEKQKGNWTYVKLPDGKKAWVPSGDIKVIE